MHVHRVPNYHLAGVKKIQVCMPPAPELAGQLAAFARIWDQAVAKLRAHGLGRLAEGVNIVFSLRRGYYARFWRDNVLCINLRDLLSQGNRAVGIILHELGHRVWFRVAHQKTRARWAADHRARRKLDRYGASFVSAYAKTNVLEDHAEGFRARVEGTLTGAAKERYERFGPRTRVIQQRLARAG